MQHVQKLTSLRLILITVAAAFTAFGVVFAFGTQGGSSESDEPPGLPAAQFQEGVVWQGKGGQGISQNEAEQFPDFPLYWLGEQYSGFNLRAIVRQKYDAPAGAPPVYARDSVTFLYGDCVIPEGAEGCPVPITITIEPACMIPPELIADEAKSGSEETVRGDVLQAGFRDGHVRLWTGDVSVFVDAPTRVESIDQLVNDLRGMNDLAQDVQPGDHLPVPDFSECAPVDVGPIEAPPVED